VISAGIGSAVTLLAQEGPQGPQGERGPPGPRGPEGSVDLTDVDVGSVEKKLDEIEALLEDVEGLEIAGVDLNDLDLEEARSGLSKLCDTVGVC